MPTRSGPERRHWKRTVEKKRADLMVKNGRQVQRIPCLILDQSLNGFKIAGALTLKRGQQVELILDEYSSTIECKVMWVGKPGSKKADEVGLRLAQSKA